MQHFDHIIVGTGQATGTLLGKLISKDATVAVIEANQIGGSCVNFGCTPTKTLVASARALYQAGRGEFFGFEAKPVLNFSRVMERMNEVRGASSEGLSTWIKNTKNITFFKGSAKFTGDKTLKVGNQSLQGKHIYLNVGTRPSAPPIEGLDEVKWLDNRALLALKELPAHLIIVGGGYIGLEFAQIFKRFGSQVTVVQRGEQLMPQEDAELVKQIQEFLEEEDVTILCNASAKAVKKEGELISVQLEKEGQKKTIKGSHLLIATGRIPNSDTLDLQKTGIKVDQKGFIEVDDHCQTQVKGVFAVGDVNGHGAFTHTSVNDGEIVLDYLFGGPRKLSSRISIYALFTDPPLGRVGLSEKEALQKGLKIKKATMPMSRIGRAKEMGETKGMAQFIVDAQTDLILGGAILGVGGDEIINMIATVMHSEITYKKYREIVLVHPTVSELMPYVFDNLEQD